MNTTAAMTTTARMANGMIRARASGPERIGPICPGMLPTMPAKMMKLMPLPRPRSLMSSPSHMSRIVPVVKLMSRLIVSMLNRSLAGMTPFALSRMLIPYPWAIARGTVSSRVYWFSLLRPYSPSRLSSSRAGITPRMSWMMMLALMYGFTPRPMIDAAASPPPEKMFRIPSSGLSVNRLERAAVFTLGMGTFVSAR